MDADMHALHRIHVQYGAARLHALLESAADADLDVGDGIAEQYAENLIASIRSGRDSR
jgi:hypothetical protein